VTFWGEALGVALTQQKRGPRRPPRTGRRGRLPIWTAAPCREILCYSARCKNIHYTANSFNISRVPLKLTKLVGAVGGRVRGPTGGAMVAGMAMAINVAVVVCMGLAAAKRVGTKISQGIRVGNHLDTGIGKGGVLVRKPFTPIQAGELTAMTSTFGLFVWRRAASPGTVTSSLSTSAVRRAGRRGLETNEAPSRRQPAARTRFELSTEVPNDKGIRNGKHMEPHVGMRMTIDVDVCWKMLPMVTMPMEKGRMEYTVNIDLARVYLEAAAPVAAARKRRGCRRQLPVART
jgi:hypothetical protein